MTISGAELQRLTYSAHLYTKMAEKPELDASLQVLLELHCRNPHLAPADLATVLANALHRYRTNAPAYLRANGFRDEILAAYLDALRLAAKPAGFVPADLALLNRFMLHPGDYATGSAAELIHSGNQRLLSGVDEIGKRRDLVDECTRRAGANAGFAEAMDRLLYPEILVSVTNTSGEIIGDAASPLHDNFTMTNLLALSLANPDGSVTISSNDVKVLFAAETQSLWHIVHTNLALTSEFNQSHPDLAAYLTNHSAQAYWGQREAAVRQGQARAIASSTAAVLLQSQLTAAPESGFTVPEWVTPVGNIVGGLATLYGSGGLNWGPLLSSSFSLINLLDTAESPDEQIVREIGDVQTIVRDLSTNMNYRFDRVDQSLVSIFDALNQQMQKIVIIEGRLDHINGSVDDIRRSLVEVQTDIHRLERHLQAYLGQLYGRGLNAAFNTYLGWESTHLGDRLSGGDFNFAEPQFFTHARDNSVDGLSAPYVDRDYTTTPTGLYDELTESGGGTTNRLDQNLNYIKKYLNDVLGQPTAGTLGQLANPRDWFVGVYGYSQLAVENPNYFRQINVSNRLDLISARGRDLTDFLRSLTFTGPNINSNLYSALENYYDNKLSSFASQVTDAEDYYAFTANFDLATWRQWDLAAPRIAATNTGVLVASPKHLIAAGGGHSLLLKSEGRVVGWGDNSYGQISGPASATNVAAIAAGLNHSLALRADGTVIGWGSNDDIVGNHTGQATVPNGLNGVIAIAAGQSHSLALKANGTVVGWGNNTLGQTDIPAGLTDAVAIAAGSSHNLALRADGTAVAWGYDNYGQADIPAGLNGVVAIAAGSGHSLALKAEGTVVAWGNNTLGQTNIPTDLSGVVAIAAGSGHSLALKADGTVVGWGANGNGETTVPPGLSNVVAIAGGAMHSLALKADGTVVGWGYNASGQCTPRGWVATPSVRNHLVAGSWHSLALRADGTVAGWGYNRYGQATPAGLSNVVAITADGDHSLALKIDGTVVGWGNNSQGQANGTAAGSTVVAIETGNTHSLALRANGTVVAWGNTFYGQTSIPAGLNNVVAIAAGYGHSLALKADGTVAGWGAGRPGTSGDIHYGQATIPAGLSDVVAIAAGANHSLALKADGTVVGWGYNSFGQANGAAAGSEVVAIAAGAYHSLALKADGTVVVWGQWFYSRPAGLTNVVAIAGGGLHSLALKADGTIVAWGANGDGQTTIPANVIDLAAWGEHPAGLQNVACMFSPITALTAGSAHTLALTASGAVLSWGINTWAQTTVPPQAQSGVQAVASGLGHSLALLTNGSVIAWGLNDFGQNDVPASAQSGIVAIGAGGKHNLALKTDGTVVAWGLNGAGQSNVPAAAQGQVVAIAAGGEHSLALKADGGVIAWGGNSSGQANVPSGAQSHVVAIAAGRYHNLALKSTGEVVAWGLNSSGQCNVPAAARSGVVAISAGMVHCLALKADGTTVLWGSGPAAFLPSATVDNVVAVAAGDQHSLLLTANTSSGAAGTITQSLLRAQIPPRVAQLFRGGNHYLVAELGRVGPLQAACTELSGAKALLIAVLELGMPYTLERDDVLHGLLYGSESLVDLQAAAAWVQTENARLEATPNAPPALLGDSARLRSQCFRDRLTARLRDLQANGQPEIPRLVGHTLRLLNMLRDAWRPVPPPTLELGRETDGLSLVLYGEPYAHYTLQYGDNLSLPGWASTSITNLHNEQTIVPPVSSGPQRFYRAVLPMQ